MPPEVTYGQARGFATAFLKGQPHKASMASAIVRDKVAECRS
jgi:pyruvate dehydrogenase (quinone)/pyruvate oxidase